VVMLAFASVGLTMVSIMICQMYQHAGDHVAVRRLNTHARWIFPAGFTVAMVVLWFVYH
jgi:hypothetical protein